MSVRSLMRALTVGAALAGASLLIFTCQGSDSPTPGRGGSADATVLQGAWTTGCIKDPAKAGYYLIDRRSFDGKAFATRFETYADEACANVLITHEQTGAFEIGQAAGEGTELDLVIGTIFMTLHSTKLVQAYNDQKICGGGWTLDEKRQLTREECAPGSAPQDDEDRIYDIFAMDGDSLRFGDKRQKGVGKSKDTRPLVLESDKTFHLQ